MRAQLAWAQVVNVDKRESPRRKLKADLVLVCTPTSTHLGVFSKWAKTDQRPIVLIEKPLEATAQTATRLRRLAMTYGAPVGVIDHYRGRWLEGSNSRSTFLSTPGRSGDRPRIRTFAYYFLEDHSGNDSDYLSSNPTLDRSRHGPIEIENRVRTLNGGLLLDLMPYPLDFLQRFADLNSVKVSSVKAAQYTGVDGNAKKRTEIDRETFAEVKFDFREKGSTASSRGVVYIGKGVGAVKSLNASGDIRIAVITGTNGASLLFDFGKMQMTEKSLTGRTRRRPLRDFGRVFYQRLLRHGTIDWERGPVVPVEAAARVVEIIQDSRVKVPAEKDEIQTYPLGRPGESAPALEDILGELR